jgi:radical SAM superfamily enzyme YgiQ (UPF0313 family)
LTLIEVGESMKLLLVNIYPDSTVAKYTLSSYMLKAYLDFTYRNTESISTHVINFSMATPLSRICSEIQKQAPQVIGYSSYVWNIEKFIEIIKTLKTQTNYIHILGGPEISLERIATIGGPEVADFYIIGEGELKLSRLISYLSSRPRKTKVPAGIVTWDKDHGYMIYESDATPVPLAELPSVYLAGALDEKYYQGGQVFVETQRGCKFRCKYCVYHKNLMQISYYPLDRVLRELDFLIIEKKVTTLRFIDAMFTSDLKRAKTIVTYILNQKNHGMRLPWIYWEFNFESVDPEFLGIIAGLKDRESIQNFREVVPEDQPQIYNKLLNGYNAVNCIGIQSFHEESLKAVARRPVKLELFREFMAQAKRNNIVLKIDLILGLPFETLSSYFAGLEYILPFLQETDHILNIHILQVLPGSDLEQHCGDYHLQYKINAPHIIVSTNGMNRQELALASIISGILFRVVNSPLREAFYEAVTKSGRTYIGMIQVIIEKICLTPQFANIGLVGDENIDDSYWNKQIFSDIPTPWLEKFLLTSGESLPECVPSLGI